MVFSHTNNDVNKDYRCERIKFSFCLYTINLLHSENL